MKKTLIALAVAASAAVSGSAMAWTANGSGGSVDLGGTLTPTDVVSPWEAKVGDAVTGLNALVQRGQKTVEIKASSAIPVLGIRNADADGFKGGVANVAPQINYGNAVDLNSFSDGVTTLTLDVKDAKGGKIGSLSAPLFTAGILSWGNGGRQMASSEAGTAFFGGLSKIGDGIASGPQPAYNRLAAISSELVEKFKLQGDWDSYALNETFSDTGQTYWATYGSGIESGKTITITLDNAVSGDDAIEWKASLPVTVTYA
ncbi:hypothetical protein ACSI0N_004276 [Escherichia coli]|nr:hypothetical protein [Escherichia coli]HAW0201230.1 hypothetical protein [Escherichia coli]HAW0238549.1 hypothetical protein [Escherichia coli]HAX2911073.1 hypothetical protein [Escherichia coli]HBB2306427.1 hypothetical protein [Escherichia coli]